MKREELFESINNQIIGERVFRAKIKQGLSEYTTIRENQKRKAIAGVTERIVKTGRDKRGDNGENPKCYRAHGRANHKR